MNSLERVRAAMRFQRPDRVPVWKAGLGDVLPLPMFPPASWQPGHLPGESGLFPYVGDDHYIRWRLWRWRRPEWARAPQFRDFLTLPREEVDEWGGIWKREGQDRSLGHPGRARFTDWNDLDSHLARYNPDPDDISRYRVPLFYSRWVGRRRYRMALLFGQGPFTVASILRGFENFMMDHALHPAELQRLLAFLTGKYAAGMRAWRKFGADPHGFVLYDDLADQTRPFLSPRMFREFYEPVFRALAEQAHALGCDLHLHTCGKIDTLIPTLMEWGIDALELDSPRMTGYEALAPFRGRIMMWGCVDIQTIYTCGTPEEVEAEVERMVNGLGTPEGGYGAYFYPQKRHIGLPQENEKAFQRGLEKYGTYQKK